MKITEWMHNRKIMQEVLLVEYEKVAAKLHPCKRITCKDLRRIYNVFVPMSSSSMRVLGKAKPIIWQIAPSAATAFKQP